MRRLIYFIVLIVSITPVLTHILEKNYIAAIVYGIFFMYWSLKIRGKYIICLFLIKSENENKYLVSIGRSGKEVKSFLKIKLR